MPLQETVMQDAVAVDEDQILARRARDRAIDDDGLAKALVLVPFVHDPMREASLRLPQEILDLRPGAVVRDHDLEVGERLVLEAREDPLEKVRALIDGDDEGDTRLHARV